MSLYVRVFTSFYTHRKTMRLRAVLGDAAYWIPPRIWAYAANNQPDGDFSSYTDGEIANLIGFTGDASSMLQALLQAGFLDPDRRIHDWSEHNAYHQTFSDRARKAATAKWEREKQKTPDQTVPDQKGKETSIASSMPQADTSIASSSTQAEIALGDSKPTDHYHKDTRTVLHFLNEAAGVHYREVDSNLSTISARLREPEVTLDGVRQMIQRQCKEWKGTPRAQYLRPETLFAKSKFDSYYANRNTPIYEEPGRPGAQRFNRNQGTLNEKYGEALRRKQERDAIQAAQQVSSPEPGPASLV